jgi:hypothetical protein
MINDISTPDCPSNVPQSSGQEAVLQTDLVEAGSAVRIIRLQIFFDCKRVFEGQI